MYLLTFRDVFYSLMNYCGGGPDDRTTMDCRNAADEALRDIANAHTWSYLQTMARLFMNAPYSTGTIQYQASGGTYPYQVTLAGGTWPDWAADGYLQLGQAVYTIDRRISDSVITLTADIASLTDLAAGSGYILCRDTYPLPADFVAQDQNLYEGTFAGMSYVLPGQWLYSHRYRTSQGYPNAYTIMGHEKIKNRLVTRFAPAPMDNKTVDYIYKRRPRSLVILSEETGTVSITSASDVVTGVGTQFLSKMVGSVFRASVDTEVPTDQTGLNPAAFEATIISVESPTSLTLDTIAGDNLSGVAYCISDPVDIETGSMRNAYQRCCEWKLSQRRIMKDKPNAKGAYFQELRMAKKADSRSYAARAEGDTALSGYPLPMRYGIQLPDSY